MVEYTVTNSLVAVDDVTVRVRRFRRDFLDEGEPTFVLVHGIGVNSQYFVKLAHDLVKYGDVVAMDLPGFGDAPQPAHPLSIAGFAAVVHQVMRFEKIRNPVVLGHSMGAQVVTELAARDPLWVDRIMLIGPPVNATERSAVQVAIRFAQSSIHEPMPVAMFAVKAYLRCGLNWFMKTLPAMITYPVQMRLSDAGARTVLMRGEHDHVASLRWLKDLQLAARERTGLEAPIMEVAGGAHSVIVAHADEVAEALIELARQPRPHGADGPRAGAGVAPTADPIRPGQEAAAAQSMPTPGSDTEVKPPVLGEATGISGHTQSVFEALVEHHPQSPSWVRRGAVITKDYSLSAGIKLLYGAQKLGVVNGPTADSFRTEGGPVAVGIPGVLTDWRYLSRWSRRLQRDGWDVHLVPELGSMTGPLHLLSRRLDAYLAQNDLHDVYFFAHSKGGLVGKMSMVGPERDRIRGMVSLGAPYAGSSVAKLAPTLMGVWDLRPEDPDIRLQFADQRANNRIVSLQARWDQHVPAGSWLPGAEVGQVDVWGHNALLLSPRAGDELAERLRRLREQR